MEFLKIPAPTKVPKKNGLKEVKKKEKCKMKKTVTKDMILLVKGQGSWSLYIDKNFNETTVFSIAHEGSGAESTIFGDLSYYRRWLRSELKSNPSIENATTPEGKNIFTEIK